MESNLTVKVGANIDALRTELNKASTQLSGFQKQMTAIGTQIAGVFAGIGARAVIDFTLQVSKLSGEAKAVKAAFDRLPNSIQLMNDLKKATGGTVSELDLMKRAVQASNFDIELAALPRLLQFATLRAQQTGQSVDYLVDSIVTGIGRKSKLILDNLGISAVALGEKLNGVSAEASTVGDVARAVGEIAEESLANMAGFSENAATKLQRLEASFTNLKVAIGDTANGTGLLGKAIDNLGDTMDATAAQNIPTWMKALNLMTGGFASAQIKQLDALRTQIQVNAEAKKQAQVIREVDRAFAEFNGNIDAYAKVITTHIYRTELLAEFTRRLTEEEKKRGTEIENITNLTEKLKGLQEQQLVQTGAALAATNREIQVIQNKISALKELGLAQKAAEGPMIPKIDATALLTQQPIANLEALGNAYQRLMKITFDWKTATLANVTQVKLSFVDLGSIVGSAVSSIADSLGQAMVGAGNFGQGVLKAVAGFARQLGEAMIAIGTSMLVAKAMIKNPYTAIAAGVALVALSAAMGAAMSSSQNNFNSGGATTGSVSRASSASSSVGNLSTRGAEIKVSVEGVIEGDQVRWILNRNTQLNNRTR